MPDPVTVFGSIDDYAKGGVQIIDDDPKNYVFSNVFEVAAKSAPYERVAVAKNFEYVIETVRAEGASPWYAAAHDEFVVCMEREVEVHLLKPDHTEGVVDPDSQGARRLDEAPAGKPMGRILLRRGHMALLPAGAAYRFESSAPATLVIQTIEGPATVYRWADICQTE